ncbi:hypothetical protein IFE17_09790 [Actinobacillus sp. GY-402]|nr:hypothetical protein IFE17_09790 [Actinobacillus sp. GY-402]
MNLLNNKRPLNDVNRFAYKKLKQVQKAIVECNTLGLEVEEIEFNCIKPRIRIKDNSAAARLEYIGRAIEYGFGQDKSGKVRMLQIMAAGIKVIWLTNRERIH